MSLQSELTRLQANVTSIVSSKDDIMAALASKGVTVPPGATLHDVPGLIGPIAGMGPVGHVTIGERTYKTVKIGTQEWMAENLDYKFQYNGSQLPIGSNGIPSTPAAWYYDDKESDYGIDGTYKCGLLYNWYAAKYLDDNKDALLPSGWHVPALSEITAFVEAISDYASIKAIDNSIATNFPQNWGGNNNIGFSIIPTGFRNSSNGSAQDFGVRCYVQSTDIYNENPDYGYLLDFDKNRVEVNIGTLKAGRIIRLTRTVS